MVNQITVKLNNGEYRKVYSKVLLGDIVKVTNAGEQYSCMDFDRQFGCYGRKTHIEYDRLFKPFLKEKQNMWVVTGMAVHPYLRDGIVLCITNRIGKSCVIGEGGVEFLKHGNLTREVKEIYQLS